MKRPKPEATRAGKSSLYCVCNRRAAMRISCCEDTKIERINPCKTRVSRNQGQTRGISNRSRQCPGRAFQRADALLFVRLFVCERQIDQYKSIASPLTKRARRREEERRRRTPSEPRTSRRFRCAAPQQKFFPEKKHYKNQNLFVSLLTFGERALYRSFKCWRCAGLKKR